MSNSRYTHIRAHGTPGAFEPGFISQASMVGPYHAPEPPVYPYLTREVQVNITGASNGKVYSLGAEIAPGSIITAVSVNGYNAILPGTTTTYQLGLALIETGPIVTVLEPLNIAIVAGVPLTPATPNTGLSSVTAVPVTTAATFPILVTPSVGIGSNADVGVLYVKIVYFSP